MGVVGGKLTFFLVQVSPKSPKEIKQNNKNLVKSNTASTELIKTTSSLTTNRTFLMIKQSEQLGVNPI